MSNRCELEFRVLQAEPREGGGVGHERVSSMVVRSSDQVLAAVNADFFTPAGATVGAEIVAGRVQTIASRPTFAWKRGEAPWMGIAESTPGTVRVGWSVDLAKGDGTTEAVGGFPDLIDHGRRVGNLEVVDRPAFAAARHPRSAVGYDSRTNTFWMVVVDGRQLPYSAGMTLPELAGLFEALGADEALNLDGGGSSAMVLRDAPVNRPSDSTGERPVVNALALTRQGRRCADPS
jgi:exopolysaccharide biosynthesis protein